MDQVAAQPVVEILIGACTADTVFSGPETEAGYDVDASLDALNAQIVDAVRAEFPDATVELSPRGTRAFLADGSESQDAYASIDSIAEYVLTHLITDWLVRA